MRSLPEPAPASASGSVAAHLQRDRHRPLAAQRQDRTGLPSHIRWQPLRTAGRILATADRFPSHSRSRACSTATSRASSAASANRRAALDAERVRVARRRHLAPRAVARILVLAPADELRTVAKAVALHLVVPHLDHELLPQAPTARARPSPTDSAPRSADPATRRRAAARAPRRRHASSPRPRTSRRSRGRRRRGTGRAATSRSPPGRPSSGRRSRRSRPSCAPSP